jgi:hypothetical protein
MSVPKSFRELVGGNTALAAEFFEAHNGNIEFMDALVGCCLPASDLTTLRSGSSSQWRVDG